MATAEPQSTSVASSGSGPDELQAVMTDETRADPIGPESNDAERVFSKSIVISGIRCLLAYIILPFVAPLIGLAPGIGAGLGLVIGIVAIAANLFSIRRFWRSDHRWKVPVTVLHVAVIGLLIVLVVQDIAELMGR